MSDKTAKIQRNCTNQSITNKQIRVRIKWGGWGFKATCKVR